MDHEVARTLGELELKLRELERELAQLGRQTAEPDAEHGAVGAPASLPSQPLQSPAPAATQPLHPSAQPAAAQPPAPAGRLVDEAIEPPPAPPIEAQPLPSVAGAALRYSMEAQETAFGEIPATRDARETIDLAELVRFRDKLQHTLQGLIDEYSRLLSLGPRR